MSRNVDGPTGDRPIVAVDVARSAGVSQKTVSRVVNRDPHVRPEVRERVLQSIRELDYRPNRSARNLVLGRTRTIGLLSMGSTDFGPAALMDATEHAVRAAGFAMTVVHTLEGVPEDSTTALHEVLAQGVDGVVINEPVGTFTLKPGGLGNLPVLSVSGSYGISSSEIVVDPDQGGGAAAATQHLLDLGHRTVHHVSGPSGWRSSSQRVDGWRAALTAAQAPVPAAQMGDWTPGAGYAAGRLLAEDPSVTAVFAANDHMAIGVLRAMHEAGRRVPQDVSVVGFDDIPEAAFLSTALTTVRQDLGLLATHGVALLVDAIKNPAARSTFEIVPVELVHRETTAPPPAGR
jgi:DNA-binding LacI/PurR family transcriptional regulator